MPKACSTCLDCDHMNFTAATPEYSEYTPGYEADMSCNKNHWVYDAYNDDIRRVRVKLYSSRTCDDFKEAR